MLGFMMAGIMTVLCVMMMMARTDMRKWLGYSNAVDVAFTIIMVIMFHDTFSGVVSAACAGVFMSLMLWSFRNTIGYKKLKLRRKGLVGMELAWVTFPGKWTVKEQSNV